MRVEKISLLNVDFCLYPSSERKREISMVGPLWRQVNITGIVVYCTDQHLTRSGKTGELQLYQFDSVSITNLGKSNSYQFR